MSTVTSSHPQFNQLNLAGRKTSQCYHNFDYTLTGYDRLAEIAENELFEESLLLWNYVVSDKGPCHHEATYRSNGSSPVQKIESIAAYYLRRNKWIPNKDGVFCRPCDITKDELHERFIYQTDSVFLKNIGFGDKSKAPNDLATALEKEGCVMTAADREWFGMTSEEKEQFLEWRQINQQIKKKKTLTEALEGSNKDQVGYEEYDYYGIDTGIKNVEARKTKQQQEFEEGLETPTSKKQVWRPTYLKSNGLEKQFVDEQYHGRCQNCGRDAIRKANGKTYFEAINIIDTSTLKDEYQNNLDAGWNTLCLCPNCAAEYKYCQKNLSELQDQVEQKHIENRSNEMIELFIILKNNRTKITFTPRHFLSLQTAFKVYKEREDK